MKAPEPNTKTKLNCSPNDTIGYLEYATIMMIEFAVNGTLMRGLELNHNLLDREGVFVEEAYTAPAYRLWSIADRHPAMMRFNQGGREIALEIWSIPLQRLGEILQSEPPGLCVGKILLSDHRKVLGVLGEQFLCDDQREITNYGGWRRYITSLQQP